MHVYTVHWRSITLSMMHPRVLGAVGFVRQGLLHCIALHCTRMHCIACYIAGCIWICLGWDELCNAIVCANIQCALCILHCALCCYSAVQCTMCIVLHCMLHLEMSGVRQWLTSANWSPLCAHTNHQKLKQSTSSRHLKYIQHKAEKPFEVSINWVCN